MNFLRVMVYILSERNPINACDNGVANGVSNGVETGVENAYVFAPANNVGCAFTKSFTK